MLVGINTICICRGGAVPTPGTQYTAHLLCDLTSYESSICRFQSQVPAAFREGELIYQDAIASWNDRSSFHNSTEKNNKTNNNTQQMTTKLALIFAPLLAVGVSIPTMPVRSSPNIRHRLCSLLQPMKSMCWYMRQMKP